MTQLRTRSAEEEATPVASGRSDRRNRLVAGSAVTLLLVAFAGWTFAAGNTAVVRTPGPPPYDVVPYYFGGRWEAESAPPGRVTVEPAASRRDLPQGSVDNVLPDVLDELPATEGEPVFATDLNTDHLKYR